MKINNEDIKFIKADEDLKTLITNNWKPIIGNHMHINDGISIVGMLKEEPIAVISVYWTHWIKPLNEEMDGYIDIIEVKDDYRRNGIAKYLVEKAEDECRIRNLKQIRSWSSDNKLEALRMWKKFGYGMCPARIISGPNQDILVNGFYVVKTLIQET
ncbi:hypothetical protein A7K91_15060 [Paenibacillus oryzae]|uniref:N-acetyltransferase domain-containing protein n=1 Tax=Paenibacillus oryzae TaxID=1844972 RepID=A0A1A5YTR3_9BACL|nr:GNAT family N-acetyltransferase [Paenibacillus oryzae]OBR68944.1 hypothetical protein A7K91_15060 [Paenibacillus oryzae]